MFKNFLTTVCLMATPALCMAEGDAAKGEKVFKKCKACHAVGEGAKHKVGPELNGVVGRAIAGAEGFKYSDALNALGAEGKTWSAEELAAFLTKPRDYAKGTKMSFAGLRKEADRDNVIAYLDSFSEGGS
ncbi:MULTISPECIES: cytochrome c family protein [unclassified Roseovarius]|uniref:c-type cytochrome n=1 Tax=unclassified Roseovarius TaxID=2614913 RepID=UPI00273D451E|nr:MULTISPECIES: cytochrome c family protein [unclassified Roseovarius]